MQEEAHGTYRSGQSNADSYLQYYKAVLAYLCRRYDIKHDADEKLTVAEYKIFINEILENY